MHYVYVLKSLKDGGWYIGSTANLKQRFEEHNKGQSRVTKYRLPLKLIYYEACDSKKDSLHREKYLKSSWGRRYLKTRIRHSA